MYVITVEFRIHEDRVEAFREAMLANARASVDDEPGCHQFDVCFDPGDAQCVFLYELYSDEAAFQTHLASAHFKAFDEQVRDWVQSKAVGAWQRQEG